VSRIAFLREFMRSPAQTGALAASTPRLTDLITTLAGVREASAVVELGSGTGVCTEAILARLPHHSRFLALEINPFFVEATRRRCPGAVVIHDDAAHVRRHLESLGITSCDAIISGLPWASFTPEKQDRLLDAAVEVLGPGGRFVTFAYLQGLLLPAAQRFRSRLRRHFRRVEISRTVWLNLPPAFVYRAEDPYRPGSAARPHDGH
jgi:phospholipid N-methyltransferase